MSASYLDGQEEAAYPYSWRIVLPEACDPVTLLAGGQAS
jgi:hypothetical protein